ncbi:MAG: BamA/TamA family outer membrane protein [Deltaproteobacteria bacterium]|nr:BamA/TamA family outer membrane protein [Deltaproteobacteria bacterium]
MPRSVNISRTMLVLAVFFLAVLHCASSRASKVEDLLDNEVYYLRALSFSGNHALSDTELTAQFSVKPRPFYQLWKKRPAFDPDALSSDLKRVRRLYEARGYYKTTVSYELNMVGNLIALRIQIRENEPVRVQQVTIELDGFVVPADDPLYKHIPLKIGEVFSEKDYQDGAEAIEIVFRNAAYAHVSVARRAHVSVPRGTVQVFFTVRPGEKAVFGATQLEGEQTVGADVVLRELAYKAGEPFSQRKLDESRDRILALNLFALVNIRPELDTRNPRVAPIRLTVKEKPKHAIAVGGGYNTQSQFIADFEWTDRNWFGDGRQLSLVAQYSNIDSTVAANFRQPSLFNSPRATGLVSVREDIQQVPTYTLFGTRLIPRLEYKFERPITISVGYQLEYDSLSHVDPSVPRALGGIEDSGIVSGPNARLSINTTNDPYNPSSGEVFTIDAMAGGGIFGGNYDFYRVVTEIKDYYLIGWGIILATRAKLGIADSIGSQKNYPLFYRFYAGGEGSVRGYPYLRLGPKSADNVPLGGLTWIEGSVELRHKIWKQLDGAAFLDFGQLSTDAYHIPINNLRFGAGPAISYETPVGPLRLDLGIPFNKPPGGPNWQVYFSIGQYF